MSDETRPFRFRRSGHIVIRCADPARTARFFREVAGLKQYGRVARGMHFLASDFRDNHHQVLVRPAKDGAADPEPDRRIGFARVAFETTTPGEVAALRANLLAHGVELEETAQPNGVAFRDPDGNLFEFYCGIHDRSKKEGRSGKARGADTGARKKAEAAS